MESVKSLRIAERPCTQMITWRLDCVIAHLQLSGLSVSCRETSPLGSEAVAKREPRLDLFRTARGI